MSYPVAIDLEDSSQANLTKQQITDIAIAFCNEIRAAGYTPIIYCNESWYRDRIDFSRISNVGRWIARYNYKPSDDISRDIWQAGSTTILPGIDGYVDIDFANTNYRAYVTPRTAADPSYVKTTGTWVYGNGWWYSYFAGGYPANQWECIGGKWYHFDANGDMATGWVWNGYNWFYTNADGAMQTGWVYDSGNWYYMNSDGVMQTGWVNDGYAWYYMYSGGSMAKNTWIGSYYVNSSGAWTATR